MYLQRRRNDFLCCFLIGAVHTRNKFLSYLFADSGRHIVEHVCGQFVSLACSCITYVQFSGVHGVTAPLQSPLHTAGSPASFLWLIMSLLCI